MGTVRGDNVQVKLEIDGSQSKTELDNLTRKAQLLKEDLKGLKKGTQEYVDANKELSQVNKRLEELRKEIGLDALTMNQLRTLSGQLNREIRDLSPGTESFIQKSKQLQEVDARLEQVRKEAKGIGDELDKSGGSFLDFVKKSATFVGIQVGIESAVSALRQLGSESIDAAAKGSDSIADMEKSLNLTTDQAKALRGQLEGIDTRTSQENLEGIAVAAGQLGVAAENADEFTAAVDQAVVALGDEFTGGVEDVTKSIGGLQKLFKETAGLEADQAITKIGSSLNALGADGSATSPVIAEFTARVGQLGDLAPEITQTLGLGAAFQELGLSAEISSGGVSNVLLTAAKDTAGFAKQLNLTQEQFSDLLNSDPNEVLLRLAASMKGASNTEIVSTLDRLGIKSQEATKVVSLLANQTDLVRQKQALAAAEFEKGTSLMDEFAKKNTNAAAEVEKAEKSFAQYRRELGEQLLPYYIKFLQYSGLLLDVLRATPKFVSDNRAGFALLALAVLTWNAALIRSTATSLLKLATDKLAELEINNLTSAQNRLNLAMEANPIGFIIGMLALLAFGLKQLYDRSETFRASVDSLFAILRPLGAQLQQIASSLFDSGGLGTMLMALFKQIGAGKIILELFSKAMTFGVVVPLKFIVLQVQATVDVLTGLLDVGKRVGNFFGADFKLDPKGSFDAFTKNYLRNANSIKDSLTGDDVTKAAQAQGEQRFRDYQRELEKKIEAQRQAAAKKAAQEKQEAAEQAAREKQAAADRAAAAAEQARKDAIQALKLRDIAVQQQQLKVKEGSQQELELKKQQVLIARDIELLAEKKSADDKALIRAKAQLELDKLNTEFGKKQAEKAAKLAQEEAEVELALLKRRAELEKDEYVRKAAALRAAAVAEAQKLKGSEAQIAEQRKLIAAQLEADLLALEKERVKKQAAIMREIEDIDADIADRRARRASEEALKDAPYSPKAKKEAIAGEEKRQTKKIDQQIEDVAGEETDGDIDLENKKLARIRSLNDEKVALHQETADRIKEIDELTFEDFASIASQGVQAVFDFKKVASDKEMLKLDKDKAQRLKALDTEYKAGRVSKEDFEKQKSSIEANYDEKTRALKRQAAKDEKAANIAQSIISGVLAVLKAGGILTPMGAATAIFAALSTAKIIATPIPEFAQGGIVGAGKALWSGAARSVGAAYRPMRTYAHGGRINATAGVANAGQLHSGGGIQMIDGATGQHLGEWERGEPYMILSRATYANNKPLIDELIDTSLYRGGAPVGSRRSAGIYAEQGALVGSTSSGPAADRAAGSEAVVQAVERNTAAIQALPSRLRVAWQDDDTEHVEEKLSERQAFRNLASIR